MAGGAVLGVKVPHSAAGLMPISGSVAAVMIHDRLHVRKDLQPPQPLGGRHGFQVLYHALEQGAELGHPLAAFLNQPEYPAKEAARGLQPLSRQDWQIKEKRLVSRRNRSK